MQDEPDIPMTKKQRRAFDAICEAFAGVYRCAANAARPGVACEEIWRGLALAWERDLRAACRAAIRHGDVTGLALEVLADLRDIHAGGGLAALGLAILAADEAAAPN